MVAFDTQGLFDLSSPPMQLILASQSPYRQKQLNDFGLTFLAEKPNVDESALKVKSSSTSEELSRELARAKALSLSTRYPKGLILGGDQIVDLDGKRLDKPGDFNGALAQLRTLSGKRHRLITSLALWYQGVVHEMTDITWIQMRTLDEVTIRQYLALDQPFDCAGSYKVERAGLSLIAHLQTQDPSAIQGLPLIGFVNLLESFSLSLHDLRSPSL